MVAAEEEQPKAQADLERLRCCVDEALQQQQDVLAGLEQLRLSAAVGTAGSGAAATDKVQLADVERQLTKAFQELFKAEVEALDIVRALSRHRRVADSRCENASTAQAAKEEASADLDEQLSSFQETVKLMDKILVLYDKEKAKIADMLKDRGPSEQLQAQIQRLHSDIQKELGDISLALSEVQRIKTAAEQHIASWMKGPMQGVPDPDSWDVPEDAGTEGQGAKLLKELRAAEANATRKMGVRHRRTPEELLVHNDANGFIDAGCLVLLSGFVLGGAIVTGMLRIRFCRTRCWRPLLAV
eukprot:gnl/TRDRNA2_/TRDRNA2_83717_c0_seq1.p1 gnl/TRDRNA2_/TRDRNA2_83717_c0~~gnl/TRDRNA2_/TRDRNA2_83717_c0_seq1.p1  ORF type:complete len:300 (-),score=95.35 gnl/TRDRNA2_/TRDRNA2_83717_c0_seq1:60-959(-)